MYVLPSLVAQTVKNLPTMQETRVRSLGQEDPLWMGMSIHFSILAWRIPWTEEPGGLQSLGHRRVRYDLAAKQQQHYIYILFLGRLCAALLLSCQVVSNSLWPHGPQHARPPCPSLSPGICSSSCPVSQWCCLTSLSSAALFFFCLQSLPASEAFPVSWLSTLQRLFHLILPITLKGK